MIPPQWRSSSVISKAVSESVSYKYVLKGIKRADINRDEILRKHGGRHAFVDKKRKEKICGRVKSRTG
jgi:hypothetical protein